MTNTPFRALDDAISVAGQIQPADVADAQARGFRLIVNNRPDGEEPGQPAGMTIAAAAEAAGIGYVAIPVDHSGLREDHVAAMRAALGEADGPVLAFCRSGTRSTFLWALARSGMGDDAGDLVRKAAAQGYDLRPLLG